MRETVHMHFMLSRKTEETCVWLWAVGNGEQENDHEKAGHGEIATKERQSLRIWTGCSACR